MYCRRSLKGLFAGLAFAALWSPATSHAGTLDFLPQASWATPLSDNEMGELRGGFRGISFTLTAFIDATVENVNGDLSGSIGTSTSPPDINVVNGNPQVAAQISGFAGSSGFITIFQVPGSFNVINSTVLINLDINIINDPTASSSLLLGSGFQGF